MKIVAKYAQMFVLKYEMTYKVYVGVLKSEDKL